MIVFKHGCKEMMQATVFLACVIVFMVSCLTFSVFMCLRLALLL